jgi:hypothetical protein
MAPRSRKCALSRGDGGVIAKARSAVRPERHHDRTGQRGSVSSLAVRTRAVTALRSQPAFLRARQRLGHHGHRRAHAVRLTAGVGAHAHIVDRLHVRHPDAGEGGRRDPLRLGAVQDRLPALLTLVVADRDTPKCRVVVPAGPGKARPDCAGPSASDLSSSYRARELGGRRNHAARARSADARRTPRAHHLDRGTRTAPARASLGPVAAPLPRGARSATIDDAALVTACLVALGGDRHFEAATALRAMARTATVNRGPQGVA